MGVVQQCVKVRGDPVPLVFPVDVLGRRIKEVIQCRLRFGVLGFHGDESRLDTRKAKLLIRLRGAIDVLFLAISLYLLTTVLNFGQTNRGGRAFQEMP
jgi:hypothetical protein